MTSIKQAAERYLDAKVAYKAAGDALAALVAEAGGCPQAIELSETLVMVITQIGDKDKARFVEAKVMPLMQEK